MSGCSRCRNTFKGRSGIGSAWELEQVVHSNWKHFGGVAQAPLFLVPPRSKLQPLRQWTDLLASNIKTMQVHRDFDSILWRSSLSFFFQLLHLPLFPPVSPVRSLVLKRQRGLVSHPKRLFNVEDERPRLNSYAASETNLIRLSVLVGFPALSFLAGARSSLPRFPNLP